MFRKACPALLLRVSFCQRVSPLLVGTMRE